MDIKILVIGIVIIVTLVKPLLLSKDSSWKSYSQGTTGLLNPIIAILSIFASLGGGFMVFGIVQMGFEGGLTGYIFGLAYLIGMPLLIIVVNKTNGSSSHDKNGMFGLDGLLFRKYGKGTLLCFYLLSGIVFSGVLGGQFLALKYFLSIYSDSFNLTLILTIGLVGTILYTILFGFRGVITNDIIQALLELSVAIIFPIYLYNFLSSNTNHVVDLSKETISGEYSILYALLGSFFLLLSFSTRADLWQRINKVDKKYQKIVIIASTLLLVYYYFMMSSSGIAIKQNLDLLNIENLDARSLTVIISEKLVENQFFLIVCLSGILIAVFSSIDSYLNLSSLSLTRLMLWKSVRIGEDENLSDIEKNKLIVNARIVTLVTSIIAGVFALTVPDITDLLSASFSILGILLPIVLMAIFRKEKMTDKSGYVPMLVSLIILLLTLPFLRKIAFVPSIIVGTILFFILLRSKRPSDLES
ncbi:MAG: hypothetical protein ABJ004_07720 [Cyclobacteriaceae bacterium]